MAGDGTWKRACDLCSYNGPFRDLTPVGNGKFHCRDDRQNWTAEQTLRHNRLRRPITIKPRRHARITGEVPLYQTDEAELFNVVLKHATTSITIGPSGATISAATVNSMADCGVYLRELLLEDKRPLNWTSQALTKLKEIGTALLAAQFGSPTSGFPSEPTSAIRYGGIPSGTSCLSATAASSGLVFLALATKDPTNGAWLAGADRCAWFLRQAQRADLLSVSPVVDNAGNPVFVGGWPQLVNTSGVPTGTYLTSDAVCLWFMARYRDVRGADYSLGTATAAGDFASAPAGTVQQSIDAALDFYVVGRFPYNTASTVKIAPLSSTSPQTQAIIANASTFTKSSSGGYVGILGEDFARGLRGVYEVEGYSARVAVIFEWLMGFTSNAAFEAVSGTPLHVLASGALGEYIPDVAMALFLALGTTQSQAPTLTTNGSSFYGTSATALLGPLYNASGRLLRTWKDEASTKRPLNGNAVDSRLPLMGSSVGLSFQLSYNQVASYSLTTLSRSALVFRAAPGAFNKLRGLP